jgi:hypothetical protein
MAETAANYRTLHLRPTTILDRLASRIRFPECYRDARLAPPLDAAQADCCERLRRDGFVVLDGHIPADRLARMQRQFDSALRELRFETPCLAQTRVEPERDADLIANYLYATPSQLLSRGLAFDRHDCRTYDQVVNEFNPSTLTAYMLAESEDFRSTWLDPFLLGVVAGYLKMIPRLAEAYVRRNFPSPFRTMNHFWHRDLNHKHYLVKAFFFLTDCAVDNGPHEFIRASHRRFDRLNDKRYYDDAEVDTAFPIGSPDRIVSEVPAGTVVIEDTRGLHRARMPDRGFRDLGYAVFMPIPAGFSHAYYSYPRDAYGTLSPFQRAFVPRANIA